ncbi:hypothetical protein [Kribbella ginsengisoli]|uniref:Uncharacterized protein n=1 Tax=Kribbella ginsengisoli TaxID=363865 RepID=A0ABP6Z8J6_9ACTN
MTQPLYSDEDAVRRAGRPRALMVGFVMAWLAALATQVSGVGILIGGKRTIRAYVESTAVGIADPEVIAKLIENELDQAYSLLSLKGWIGIGTAALVLIGCVVAVRANRGATRGLVIVALLANMIAAGLQLGENELLPDLCVLTSFFAALMSICAIVPFVMPSVRRHGRARRAGRA